MFRKILIVPQLVNLSDILQFRLWIIFFLSFSSSIPFLLILSTLSVWLTEAGVSKTQIGIFSWVTVSYAFKLFLAPLFDHYKAPI